MSYLFVFTIKADLSHYSFCNFSLNVFIKEYTGGIEPTNNVKIYSEHYEHECYLTSVAVVEVNCERSYTHPSWHGTDTFDRLPFNAEKSPLRSKSIGIVYILQEL